MGMLSEMWLFDEMKKYIGRDPDLDIGTNHYLNWLQTGDETHEICGALLLHLDPQGNLCVGSFSWAPTKYEREHPEISRIHWELMGQVGPQLTISPSLLCSCGDHGFITNGKWVSC
jgi:hypothetical protein